MTHSSRAVAAAWLDAGRAAVRVEVAATRGSAPRACGTCMLVAADATAGTIGGGHLELKAITHARLLLEAAARGAESFPAHQERYALGASLGQCCGGEVTLRYAVLDALLLAAWPPGAPLFRLQLHGAGHVGRAVATLLATLDCEVDWFDQRDDEFGPTTTLGSPWPAHIRRIAIDTVEAEVAQAAPGDCYLVLTHEHALDLRIVESVLRRGDFAFCGLIGSKTKRATFARRLAERRIDVAMIERLVCPIGWPGIEGKQPEIIAAAVLAQLLAVAQPSPSQLAPGSRSQAT